MTVASAAPFELLSFRRTFALLIVLVVLPSAGLSDFGVLAIINERAAVEDEIHSESGFAQKRRARARPPWCVFSRGDLDDPSVDIAAQLMNVFVVGVANRVSLDEPGANGADRVAFDEVARGNGGPI